MRLYTFVNMYLSPIQHGIQTAHIVSDLFVKYSSNDLYYDAEYAQTYLYDWAENHKTIIVKNGGFSSNLIDIYDQISNQNVYPCAIFREEVDALNSAVTAVGIVLPADVYKIDTMLFRDGEELTTAQRMAELIAKYRLA